MKIEIKDKAQKWFEEEFDIPKGSGIRFLGKVYGKTEIHDGFSVGMAVEKPDEILASTGKNGMLFYISPADEWFFNGHDLEVDFDEEKEEPIYHFPENEQHGN